MASHTFSTTQLAEYWLNVDIKMEGGGATLSYDYTSKKIAFAGEEYKAKNRKSPENIILSALLIYAKYSEEEEWCSCSRLL
jgi:hypothetical protein